MAESEDQRARQERRNFLKRKCLDETQRMIEEATWAHAKINRIATLKAND